MMNDNIIDKARTKWCGSVEHTGVYSSVCPPEVVSALMDVLDEVFRADSCVSCFGHRVYKHRPGCLVKQAEAAIARALGEQKP